MKILMSNVGYALGIDGRLGQHVRLAHRHLYCHPVVQQANLRQLRALIEQHDPDLCCFAEIDTGSLHSGRVNHLEHLRNEHYPVFDAQNKYAQGSRLQRFAFTQGRSNGFMAKRDLSYERRYFQHGLKRLVYRFQLDSVTALYFAHFSLNRKSRHLQILQAAQWMREEKGEVVFLGDFNILTGFGELAPILESGEFLLLNNEHEHTFTFHRQKRVLDLCLCSRGVAERSFLAVLPQAYSDHAALLLEMRT